MNLRAAAALVLLLASTPVVAAPTASAPTAAAPASEVRPTALDVVSLSDLGAVALSPDGSRVAWAVRQKSFDPAARAPADFDPAKAGEADQKAGWKVVTQLWTAPADGGEPRQLTFATEASTGPVWSPDGATLGFLRKKDGKARIHLLPIGGGEAHALDTGAAEPQAFAFAPDGRRVAFTASLHPAEAEKQAKWASGGAVRWDREWQPTVLYVMDLAGGAPRAVTSPNVNVVAFDWSPDGKRFAALLSSTSDPYEASSVVRPAILTDGEGAASIGWLEEKPGTLGAIRWSPDGRHVAYDLGAGTLSLLNHLVVREVNGTGRWNAAARLDPTLTSFAWTGDGSSLLALVADRTVSRIYRLARDGSSARDIGFSGRVIRGPIATDKAGRRLAFGSSTSLEPSDPTLLEVASGRARVLAQLNPQAAGWPRVETEVVSWKNPEGTVIEGILTLPPGAAKGAKVPLWVFPHGGPDDVSQVGFSGWVRFFAARGYAVLRPNYRGSTGYGFDFYAANRGRLGEVEFMDIESGVDSLVAAGRVDPARLVYGSWSWGGYLTAWTIGHTRRYRAAMAGAAIVDTISQYALSDINHGVAAAWEFKGNPWLQPDQFDRSNPLRFLRDARTPTLVVHGQADDRVPFMQGQILYRALRDVGCEVEFLAFPREPHGFQEPAHAVHLLRAWSDWYARFDP
jgi:dipeptidyl aminopeptidase/acylaminoacyl peptidase